MKPHPGRRARRQGPPWSDARITALRTHDVRFPTSDHRDGSDAMHVDPDYSAAYVVLETDVPGLEGAGLSFTIGRGTEVVAAACRALAPLVVGRRLSEIRADWAGFWRALASDPQLRWIGPEKGVIHLATAAVVNAAWDLAARAAGVPLWRLLADMGPEELVACIDFRYLTDALTPEEALEILRAGERGRAERARELHESGFPSYTTSAGWLGYSDEKIRNLCRAGLAEGWRHFKLKVGANADDDLRRVALVRAEIGPGRVLMLDANQRWGVSEAIARTRALARFDPLWIEEPTSPDDVLGHAEIARAVAPIGVATGEQVQNRVVFKQLFQARAISYCQADVCRLGGLNEYLAVLIMSKKFGVPVCPHAGGVGLCQYVNHLATFDYLGVGCSLENRVAEYVDHLHEHFETSPNVAHARYLAPSAPGFGVRMKSLSIGAFEFPDGPVWRERLRRAKAKPRARAPVPARAAVRRRA
jgi:L-fuconate dehydratase